MPPPEVADPLPSQRFGKFVRTQKLGAGGMGEVWKAWDTQLSRWVALKFLKGGDAEEVARFQREAQVAGRLSHPNIAAIYEVGGDQGQPFIAMQYVEGQTLKTHPRQDRKLLVRLLRDAARAVAFAHEQGVVHRDLKPENVMVTSRGHVYVMDFGLARAVEGGERVSATGAVIGTPAYMSPEQARGQKVDGRADVYGLGATLYELVTERVPFRGSNVYEVLRSVEEEEPKGPRRIDPKIDGDLETIVLKCLEKDPVRRYASASALAEDLERWLAGEPVAARPASAWYRLRKKIVRRREVMAVGLALLVVSGAALAFMAVRASQRQASLQRLASLWSTITERKREMRQGKLPGARALEDLARAVQAVEGHIREWPNDPRGYYVRARGQMYLGNLAAAEKDLGTILARWPDFRPGWSLLGLLKMELYNEALYGPPEESGDRLQSIRPVLEDAIAAFEQGGAAGTREEEWRRWGLAWTREDEVTQDVARAYWLKHYRKDDVAARRHLESAFERYRAEEYASLIGGWSDTVAGNMDWQTIAIELAPAYHTAYFTRAFLRAKHGDKARAIADYDRAIEIKKDFAWAYLNRGNAKRDQGDLLGAIADYDRVVELRPDYIHGYSLRARARKAGGEYAAAIADYDRVVELRKDFVEAYNDRGLARQLAGDAAGAMADFDRAVQLRPDYAEAYNNRGLARQLRGDVEGALADFDRAIAAKKDFAEPCFNRALLKKTSGDTKGAIADYGRAIEIRPDYVKAYHNRGIARATLGDHAGAVADLDRAIELDAKSPDAYAARALSRRSMADLAGAIADLEKALELAPANWPHRRAIEDFLAKVRREHGE